jgi:hypothetical protein
MSTKKAPRSQGRNYNVFSPDDINKSSSDVRTVLTKIFRTLVFASGRNPIQKWNELMDEYVAEINRVTPLSPKAIGYTRGNTKSELMNEKMSWPVFYKGLRFLKFKSFRIVIIAQNENNETYYTDEVVNIATNTDDDEYSISKFNLPVGGMTSSESNEMLEKIISKHTKKE